MPYPWTATILVALVIYGAILLFFCKLGRELMGEMLFAYPDLALWTPFGLFACYLYYCNHSGGIHWHTAWGVFTYFLIPALLLCQKTNKKLDLRNGAAILFLWLPFDLHLVTRRPNAIRDALDWPIIALAAVIIGLVFWVGLHQLEGTKTKFRFSFRDLGTVMVALLCLAAMMVPLGYAIGFLRFGEFWATELPSSSVLAVLWNHVVTWKFLTYVIKIYVTIALSEEFLFRGIIQNMLDCTLSSKMISLTLGSLIFGAAHLNNGATSLHPAGWNWSYMLMASLAGLAYGWVFRRTASILYPMLLHALVDAIWHTLFK